ncbi:hypothetical protein BaRGS_00008946 [Batillaria attramentaria]|uniref:SGNH hydrolase-type esterase domain-containing protein n=1 Tax=Batillaria attramentaria TaxID=370345 RepID=A0ABD0LK81_9CAEN
MRATERSLTDIINSSVQTLSNNHVGLNERVSQLFSCKDSQASKIHELKKQLEPLSKSPSVNSAETVKKPTSGPTSLQKAASPLGNSQQEPESSGSPVSLQPMPHSDITTGNRFSVLAVDEDDGVVTDSSTDAVADSDSRARRSTPLDQLKSRRIQPNVNTLLLGDSVLKRVDEHKMSVEGDVVQNLSVSGLTVSQMMEWLNTLSPVQHIRKVTFHVGINSCEEGPVNKQTWVQLINLLTDSFPKATLQASSIVPPRGQYHRSKAAFTSNHTLKAACGQRKIRMIDHTPTFLTANGAPRQALYADKLHPSRDGTRKLALNIRFAGVPRDFVMVNEGRMARHVRNDTINHESGERRNGAHHHLHPPKTYQQEYTHTAQTAPLQTRVTPSPVQSPQRRLS